MIFFGTVVCTCTAMQPFDLELTVTEILPVLAEKEKTVPPEEEKPERNYMSHVCLSA